MVDEADAIAKAEAEEQRLATYRRHKYCFASAALFTFLAALGFRAIAFFGLPGGPEAVVGRLLTSASALVGGWLAAASGVYAVRARQHMFALTPRMSNDMAFATGSTVGAKSVWVIAGLLVLWGAALLATAARVWVR